MSERTRPVGPDDLLGLALALGVLAPVRRRRPRSALRESARRFVYGALMLGALLGVGLALLEY